MVRQLIRELANKYPAEGIALHGTSYEKARGIKKEGLIKGNPYWVSAGGKLEPCRP